MKKEKKQTSKKKIFNINPLFVLKYNIAFNISFLISIVVFVVLMALNNNAVKYITLGFVLLTLFATLVTNTLILIEVIQVKWYLYIVLFAVGHITAFIMSIVANFLLLRDLKNKILILKVEKSKWMTNDNTYQKYTPNNFSQYNDKTSTVEIEDAEVVK